LPKRALPAARRSSMPFSAAFSVKALDVLVVALIFIVFG
jgi:hypothetical protein